MTYTPLKKQKLYDVSDADNGGSEPSINIDQANLRLRLKRLSLNPKILLLEPFYPPEAAWGSVKTEQGYIPPLGTLSIHRWLTEKGYDIDFIEANTCTSNHT